MTTPILDPILSNVRVYRDIATNAHIEAETLAASATVARNDGSGGSVVTYDPLQRSFKASLVAIVFAGMYIEALCWLIGCQRLGVEKYRDIDAKPIEKRLAELGVTDAILLEDALAFRKARKELVHEKALPPSIDLSPVRSGQGEALRAIALLKRVERTLGVPAT